MFFSQGLAPLSLFDRRHVLSDRSSAFRVFFESAMMLYFNVFIRVIFFFFFRPGLIYSLGDVQYYRLVHSKK